MKLFWTDPSGQTLEIEFDASVSESHKASAEITKHPLETGSSVTDHVVAGPEMLELEARISNTPIREPSSQMRGAAGAVRALDLGRFPTRIMRDGAKGQGPQAARYEEGTRGASGNVLQFSGPFDRVGDVHKLLLDLRRIGQVVTVVTSLKQYENMVISELTAPRDAENGNAVTFTISLEQIFFADSQTVATPAPSQPRGHGAANRGTQPTTTPSSDDSGSESLLHQGLSFIRRAVGN